LHECRSIPATILTRPPSGLSLRIAMLATQAGRTRQNAEDMPGDAEGKTSSACVPQAQRIRNQINATLQPSSTGAMPSALGVCLRPLAQQKEMAAHSLATNRLLWRRYKSPR
jgi:hypothetical protein